MRDDVLVIRIEGEYKGQALKPDFVPVTELKQVLEATLKIKQNDNEAPILFQGIEEGSIKLLFHVGLSLISQFLERPQGTELPSDWAFTPTVLEIQRLANANNREGIVYELGVPSALEKVLRIDKKTEWKLAPTSWLTTEKIVVGEIVALGGAGHPNIHFQTEEYGTLIIHTNREELKNNRTDLPLYIPGQRLRVKLQVAQDSLFTQQEINKEGISLVEVLAPQILDRNVVKSFQKAASVHWEGYDAEELLAR